jgi:DNA-binding GntR family transcriptional regulator
VINIDHYVVQSQQSSQTIADAIAGALRRAVLDGVIGDGTVLRQADLAAQFGASRIPVREALLKLEAEGLVQTQPRRGAVVVSLNGDDFEEILDMRAALEPLALRLAIPRMTAQDFKSAETVLLETEQGVRLADRETQDGKREFETRWGDLNWEFHRALYRPARRQRLLDSIENLHGLFARHLRVRVEIIAPALFASASQGKQRDTGEWASALKEHRDILAACQRGDARTACSVLTRHISAHGVELVKRLRRSGVQGSKRS